MALSLSIQLVKKSEVEKILIDTLTRLGVNLRREQMDYGSGGFCRLDEEPIIIFSPDLSLTKRIDLFLYALKRLDTSGIYLPPAIRDLLEEN
jgi:hypothetical protein